MSHDLTDFQERCYTVNDRYRSLTAALTDQDGTAIDITGGTVTFRMTNIATGSVKVSDAAANIDVAASGYVSYDWGASDLDTAGIYSGQFTVTLSGKTEHWPCGDRLRIVVKEAV